MNKQEAIKKLEQAANEIYFSEDESVTEVDIELAIMIIEQIDEPKEPDKVVIPRFVADFIEKAKSGVVYVNSSGHAERIGNSAYKVTYYILKEDVASSNVFKWVKGNTDLFIRAWLDGYEIEKEKRYRVALPFTVWDDDASELNETTMFLAFDITSDETQFSYSTGERGGYRTDLTESQIKSIDERYWPFAEEVTE